MESIDLSMVDWARGQFALTAMYHWLFVPLTLGLGFIVAIMETIYFRTGDPEWKRITKFWMTLFGINFAIGVATGIILEFEFGTNWSNYSWFVGDIFGAPLAIEGIMAFFMESTFIAIMFFGWNKVSKKFHLASTWLTAFGANLSALWILVANGWMQFPAGMHFNPDTARNEMISFWDVALSPVAINKFLHTITSAYVLASIFVVGISAWFLIRQRHVLFSKRSIIIASVFGLTSSVYLVWSGDGSAYQVTHKQPMKLAAMEGLYEGKQGAGIVIFGVLNSDKKYNDAQESHLVKIEVPKLLSFLGYRDAQAFVPGIKDLMEGGFEYTDTDGQKKVALSAVQKIEKGKLAIKALADYKEAKKAGNDSATQTSLVTMNENFQYFGYGFLNDPEQIIPPVPITFYSFRIMVTLAFWFILVFILALIFVYKDTILQHKWFLRLALLTIPLAYVASQCGWLVAEMGRQPWVIQDIMPTVAAVSKVDSSAVIITFFLFLVVFTSLLVAEIGIMRKQIQNGPKED
ncbi:MAG TPA: cytochrome ubiquinol oxidase subunit I [Marinilabiliales bacterium]|jgi:cytochrome d ubiquinol oxidase subunit I|nr:MAG: cytochrome C oxidase subunit II [Bacteroidetes bacterium GWA2_40_14]OFX61557.1 MAG: cytochrome C oxidase subunit II [Bacteroidetes bacterium GWC2_40_13]OFX73567.1 MAG: cytochrome C oxidase subunit II [Bacteroidetes bacterium GWD2_40_43]OFX90758.1 MAG: cytochrome C oxidase subunit II [Bacteroidetes bacterium GWE2_40_63]OFY20610.1 MAG: cytochrome C oxidase subunit II [Bacteroidetes bacterium GWF2_40_13]OFZ24675.1 MAG: cytochrome C oxidase subunit II [Bacteroidetes bacterium RIFOXYC2_FULL